MVNARLIFHTLGHFVKPFSQVVGVPVAEFGGNHGGRSPKPLSISPFTRVKFFAREGFLVY
jgi:hypothetical protein